MSLVILSKPLTKNFKSTQDVKGLKSEVDGMDPQKFYEELCQNLEIRWFFQKFLHLLCLFKSFMLCILAVLWDACAPSSSFSEKWMYSSFTSEFTRKKKRWASPWLHDLLWRSRFSVLLFTYSFVPFFSSISPESSEMPPNVHSMLGLDSYAVSSFWAHIILPLFLILNLSLVADLRSLHRCSMRCPFHE